MKNYYVVKDDNYSKFYTSQEFHLALEYTKHNPAALMKGFYNIEEAKQFYNKKSPNFYYVVKSPNFSRLCVGITEANNYKNMDKDREIVVKTRDYEIATHINSLSYQEYKNEKQIRDQNKHARNEIQKKKRKKRNRELKKITFNDDFLAFADCEANDSKAISIGLVIYDNNTQKVVEKFYSLIKPYDFLYLEPKIKKITKLTNYDIDNAPSIHKVSKDIIELIEKYNIKYIFTWGNDDKRYIENHNVPILKEYSYKIKDIQPIVSKVTEQTYHNRCMSLSNMKQIYHIDDEIVTHNALQDTIDLVQIYKEWKNEKPIDKKIIFTVDIKH